MNYELAKKLKDAGFPLSMNGFDDWCRYNSHMSWERQEAEYAYEPTLEELIEACGEKFHGLWNGGTNGRWDSWSADSWLGDNKNIEEYGTTTTEAVANLWLALNK